LSAELDEFRLSVVGSSSDDGVARHRDVLDDNLSTSLAGNSNPSRAGSDSTRDLEEVVGLSSSGLPGFARVGRHFHLGSAAVGVDNLGGEPVGRNAGLHVNLDVTDDWARDVVPGDIDDTLGWSGESSKGVREEVEVVGATAWALVDNL